ncbi:MAG: hypothetical protein SF123_07675 [Chloroflexota bacterium]|nr:hypothetical protein [Chloroflexota bacterium]
MGKHTNGRIYAAAPLVAGQDDDLIQWLQGLPDGKRAPEIKKMLRLALFGTAPEAAPGVPETPLLREMQEQQARTVKWMEEWIKFFQDEITAMKAVGFTPGATATVEAVPQMDDDEAARLAAKMKKASW